MNGINLLAALIGSIGATLAFSAVAGTAEGFLSRLGGRASSRVARWMEDESDPYRVSMLADRPFLDCLLGPLFSDLARRLGSLAGTAERDAALLLQAGYPHPFNTLGDLYGWKVITAFLFFLGGLLAAAVEGVSSRTICSTCTPATATRAAPASTLSPRPPARATAGVGLRGCP